MIREYTKADLECTARVWLRAGQAEYHYLSAFQELDENKAIKILGHVIQEECSIWVYESNQEIVGFMAMQSSYIDRLYIDPDSQGSGFGSELLNYAKEMYPKGLSLKTHQLNERACAFYEARGFVVVGYGLSPRPESMPDVEYQWVGE